MARAQPYGVGLVLVAGARGRLVGSNLKYSFPRTSALASTLHRQGYDIHFTMASSQAWDDKVKPVMFEELAELEKDFADTEVELCKSSANATVRSTHEIS